MPAMFIPGLRTARAAALAASALSIILTSGAAAQSTAPANATADWRQFRGPGALGRSDATGVPTTWSDEENVVWKMPMPGPGASSPITLGNRVFLTCFTGFKAAPGEPGEMSALKRHLLCLNLADGKILWNTAVPAELPEQERIREDHGYASSTPVTDGERVYTFFGKSGVFAFDLNGKQLWRTSVGTNLNGWGSATSPIIHKDLLLVNASVESGALVALDKRTGKEVWRATGVNESWHAPVLVTAADGKTEVVVAVIKKVMGFDVADGKPLWQCDTGINWYMCPTPIAENGVIYAVGGRTPSGGLAVRAGGRGDVTQSHVLWKTNKGTNVPSPILHAGHLYYAHDNLGVAYCLNAKTGEMVYEERLSPSPGGVYASPILAGGNIYYTGRQGRTVIVAAQPALKVLGEATLENNRGVFTASAAVAGNRLLLRSNRFLYCLGNQ
jgi:outer membrane protein assembly factor BamB